MKNHHEENSVFTHFRLIFYCYLLIIVNELGVKILKFNNLKNEKNENIVKTMVSILNRQKRALLEVCQWENNGNHLRQDYGGRGRGITKVSYAAHFNYCKSK